MDTFAFLGMPGMVLIGAIALIVFGPQRMPEIGRQIGAMLREVRKITGELQGALGGTLGLDALGIGAASRWDALAARPITPPLPQTLSAADNDTRESKKELSNHADHD